MCGKKSGRGLKRTAILSLCLVLVATSLTAASWPWAWAKKESLPQKVDQVLQEDLSQTESIERLKSLLIEQETELKNLRQESTALLTEIERLKTLSPISQEAYLAVETALAEEVALRKSKETQALEYWQELTVVKAKLEKQTWGGMAGGSATYDLDTGKIGAEVTGGISFKKLSLVGGVEWQPEAFTLTIPKITDLKAKIGLQYRF